MLDPAHLAGRQKVIEMTAPARPIVARPIAERAGQVRDAARIDNPDLLSSSAAYAKNRAAEEIRRVNRLMTAVPGTPAPSYRSASPPAPSWTPPP